MGELGQSKAVAMEAAFKAKGTHPIVATLAHSREDGLLHSVALTSQGDSGQVSGRHRVQGVADPVREVAIDAGGRIKVAIDDIRVELFVRSEVLQEGIVVVAKRKCLCAAKVEQDITIDIDDIRALRLLIVNESVHL